MANVVEVIVQGTDRTGPAMQSALANTKRVSSEVKGLGIAFSQAGNVAAQFGQVQLASVIGALDASVMSVASLTKELGKSKLAMAALGTGAVAAGYSIGETIRKYIPFFNEVDKLEAANKVGQQTLGVQNQRFALRDPEKAAQAQQISGVDAQLSELAKVKDMTDAQKQLQFQLESYKKELTDKFAEERFQKESEAGFKLQLQDQQWRIETLAAMEEFSARKLEVAAWESQQRRAIDDAENVSEAQKQETKVTLARLAASRIEKINKDQKDAETAKWKANLSTFANYTGAVANGLGQLASVMEQGGKKQFKAAKALRYGEAVMSTASGIARCYADYPLWLAIPMSVIVAAAGAAQISAISSAKGPQAHSGLDYVPQEATYKLQRGEMVLDPGTSDAVREAAMGRAGSGGGQSIIVEVLLDGVALFKAMGQASRDGRLVLSARGIA